MEFNIPISTNTATSERSIDLNDDGGGLVVVVVVTFVSSVCDFVSGPMPTAEVVASANGNEVERQNEQRIDVRKRTGLTKLEQIKKD